MTLLSVDDKQHATLLAALRLLQAVQAGTKGVTSEVVQELYVASDGHTPMDEEELDTFVGLVQRPNLKLSVLSPDGFEIDREPYDDIGEAVQAGARFPLRFVGQGYYRDVNGKEIPIEDIPAYLEVRGFMEDPEGDED